MRISDWSSDVCSSDLSKPLILRPFETLVRPSLTQDTTSSRCLRIGGRSPFRFVRLIRYPTHIGCSCLLWMSVRVPHRRSWMKGDRKRVVSGKSWSVRVDLGGGRIIKKQIKQQK